MRYLPAVLLLALTLLAAPLWNSLPARPASAAPRELKLLWRSPTSWVYLNTPVVVGDKFYLSVDWGSLTEISIVDGRVRQEIRPIQEGSYKRPTIDGSSLFLSCGNANVSAYDFPGQDPCWSTYVVPPDSFDCCGTHMMLELSPPAADKSRVFFASQDGDVYCLDRDSGAIAWKRRLKACIVAAPLVFEGTVYVAGFDSCLSAIDATSGDLLWQTRLGEEVEFTEPKTANKLIYLAGRGGSVFCVDPASGTLRWKKRVGAQFRGPISVSDKLVCAADERGIYGLNALSGNTRWRRDIEGSGPVEASGRIYCFASLQDLLVLDRNTGTTVGYYAVGEPGFFNQPVVTAKRILVAARGEIYCFADLGE